MKAYNEAQEVDSVNLKYILAKLGIKSVLVQVL
jgi:hypothetical protein